MIDIAENIPTHILCCDHPNSMKTINGLLKYFGFSNEDDIYIDIHLSKDFNGWGRYIISLEIDKEKLTILYAFDSGHNAYVIANVNYDYTNDIKTVDYEAALLEYEQND